MRTVPLDFQWLAINAQADNVSLLGPDGHPTKLVRLGKELSLLNNSVYKFEVEQSGVYELYDSGQPLSRFSLHPSDCYCPQGIEQFLSRYECQKDMIERVKASMERWPSKSITREMFEQQTGLHYSDTVLQFAVLDNKLYCRKVVGFDKCPFPDAEEEFDFSLRLAVHLIQSVLRKVELPDVAFFWNFDDGPHQDHYVDAFQPLFSASASDFHGDLLLPTYVMIHNKFWGFDVMAAASGRPWDELENKAYFVGRLTGNPVPEDITGTHLINPRLRAAELARERPDLLNVTITRLDNQVGPAMDALIDRGIVRESGEPVQSREPDFKYVLDLPGNSASWRLSCRIGEGGVTIKNRTPWTEWWTYLLRDRKNVLFVSDWLADLVPAIEDARKRDAKMRCIAREAQLLMLTKLRQEDMICWEALSFLHLATKLDFKPSSIDDLVEIPMVNRDRTLCMCTA